MKIAIIFILLFGLLSCNGFGTKNDIKNTITREDVLISDNHATGLHDSISDSIERFVVDVYPITNEILLKQAENNPFFKFKSGKTISVEKAWFQNDDKNEVLVFQLATDYHRYITYHFIMDDVPIEIINHMELHDDNGELALESQKITDFNGFLSQGTILNQSFFVSNKGFKLGDNKQKSISIYREPDSQTTTNGIETLKWEFIGEEVYNEKINLNGKPIAMKSFGNKIIMYFRNEKLIGQIIMDDIP